MCQSGVLNIMIRRPFSKTCSRSPWPVIDTFDNVEDSLDAFNLLFNEVLDNHAPIRNIKVRNRPCPFMTEEIRSLMKIRDKWRKLARKTNDPLHWSGYKTRKREVKRELRLAEREFVADQIKNNPNNARCLWKTIRSCIPNKSACRRSFTKDDILVANEFNTFFSSIGQTTIEKVKLLADECKYLPTKSVFTPRIYAESEQFVLQMVESKQVHDIINSMPTNKSPGIDKISMRVIKDSLPAILPTITSIFNASLTSGVFPSAWKMAEITPIPKEGDHEQANNNRPISLLPMLSKVCEKVVLNQVVSYLDINKRLSTEQSGNKKYHWTETSLIETTDTFLHAIDKKEVTAAVLLDMSKAFDSLDHKILMLKLQDVGMSPGALNWFSSYLSNRQQVVRINSALSGKLTAHSGVPQGSILGPILFSIYVNDLPTIPQHCSSKVFVDDNKLYTSFPVQQCELAVTKVNEDLRKIRDWCFDNRLLLNVSKTKRILFGSRQMIAKIPDFRLTLFGKELIPVPLAKDLGLLFDSNLSFGPHVVKMTSSCMSSLGQINRAKYALDRDLLTMIVIQSLVFSKMYYCSIVWSNTTASNICKLQAVQNFAARIITNSRKFDHVTPLRCELHWLPVKLHLFYRDAILTFKCMNGMAPDYLSEKFVHRGSISGRCTRNSQSLNIPLYKSATGQRTFYYRAVSLWNDLPANIKTSTTLNVFKTNLRRYLFETLTL